LHSFKDGPGDCREFAEMIMKPIVAAFLDREVDIGKCVCHLVKSDILSVGVIGVFPEKMIPGKIDAVFGDMTFEGLVVEAIPVPVFQDMDGPEMVEEIVPEAEGKLHCGSADQQWHDLHRFDVDVFELFYLHKDQYPLQKAPTASIAETPVIGIIPAEQGVVDAVFVFIQPAQPASSRQRRKV